MAVGFSLQQAVGFTSRALPQLNYPLRLVSGRLAAGESFARAVQPLVNVDLQVQLSLAEHHGNLAETLNEIGKFMALQQKQRQKLHTLLQYPLLLIGMLTGLLVALKLFVFPEISSWQGASAQSWWQQVPWQILLACALAIVAVSLACQLSRWRKRDANQRAAWLSRLPVVGKMFRDYFGYYLVSNLAVMLKHGLSMKECCQVAASFDRRSLLAWWGRAIAQSGKAGGGLLDSVRACPYLPRELPFFFERGLTASQLADELTAYHRLLFRRLLTATERLLVLVQPALFLVVAAMIVAMYLSILLPIYHTLQGVY